MTELGEFEGRIVTKTTIAVRNAGDGLSRAMKVDPVLLHQGDTVYVVMECQVGKVTFDPYDDGVCSRVQNLNAGTATIIDGDVVRDAIDSQRERIRVREEADRGVHQLPTQEALAGEHKYGAHERERVPGCDACEDEWREEHRQGLHRQDLVLGCPDCDEEVALDGDE